MICFLCAMLQRIIFLIHQKWIFFEISFLGAQGRGNKRWVGWVSFFFFFGWKDTKKVKGMVYKIKNIITHLECSREIISTQSYAVTAVSSKWHITFLSMWLKLAAWSSSDSQSLSLLTHTNKFIAQFSLYWNLLTLQNAWCNFSQFS